jgi:hypothetical protein
MAGDGRFKPGYDPRRNMRGGTPGQQHKDTIERRRAADKAEKELIEQMDADPTTPLQYLLRTMKHPDLDRHERFAAAKAAAPYIHPQLQAVAYKHMDAQGNPIAPTVTVTIEEAVPEPEVPLLTRDGPKQGDKVQ